MEPSEPKLKPKETIAALAAASFLAVALCFGPEAKREPSVTRVLNVSECVVSASGFLCEGAKSCLVEYENGVKGYACGAPKAGDKVALGRLNSPLR